MTQSFHVDIQRVITHNSQKGETVKGVSIDECINSMWYKSTMKHYPVMKREWSWHSHHSRAIPLSSIWCLGEARHQKLYSVRSHSHKTSRIGKSIESGRGISMGGGLGRKGEGMLTGVGWWTGLGSRQMWRLHSTMYMTKCTECTFKCCMHAQCTA